MTEKEKLYHFALKVGLISENLQLTNQDFEMMRLLGLDLFDSEFLKSVNVVPPSHWWHVFELSKKFGFTFQEVVLWLLDSEMSRVLMKSKSPSLVQFDFYLCMCEGTSQEYSAKFLRRLCIIYELNCEEFSLKELSKAFKFSKDSLTLNFINCFALRKSQDFRVLVARILQHFCSSQLKKISISHLYCQGIGYKLLDSLISSNSSSLIEIFLKNNSLDNPLEKFEKIHLPNIERIAFYAGRYSNPAYKFIIGKKLKSLEGFSENFMFTFPNEDELHIELNKYCQYEEVNLLKILKNYPDLECISSAKTDGFEYSDSTKSAFKSLKKLRKFDLYIQGQIEQYIGSNVIEKLCFHQEGEINWKFIMSLERLAHLEIRSKFVPNDAFNDFLKRDRLIELSLFRCIFPESQGKVFFKTIQNLKNLKVLQMVNSEVLHPCLGSSIEVLSIEIASENFVEYFDQSKYFQTLLSFLPSGEGVKILNIDIGGHYRWKYRIDLTKFYPKLQKVKANFGLSQHPAYKLIEWPEPLCEEIHY